MKNEEGENVQIFKIIFIIFIFSGIGKIKQKKLDSFSFSFPFFPCLLLPKIQMEH